MCRIIKGDFSSWHPVRMGCENYRDFKYTPEVIAIIWVAGICLCAAAWYGISALLKAIF